MATHCNLSKLLIATKVEAQALKQVYRVRFKVMRGIESEADFCLPPS